MRAGASPASSSISAASRSASFSNWALSLSSTLARSAASSIDDGAVEILTYGDAHFSGTAAVRQWLEQLSGLISAPQQGDDG